MSNNASSLVPAGDRIELVDALRGIAVCGILVGNMQWFSGYGMVPPAQAASAPAIDQIVTFLVHFVVEGKFYSIFSFLFGFGFALQIARAEERGDTKALVFKRRLFWLFVIGVLHATLLWYGDILCVYALMGFVLLLFRKRAGGTLLKWVVALIAVPVVTYAALYALFAAFVPPETLANFDADRADRWNQSVATVAYGSYATITTEYNLSTLVGRWIGLIIQMRLPKILAMFLLGVYAYRLGIFQNPAAHRPLFLKVLGFGAIVGIAGNAAMAALAGNEAPFPPSLRALAGVFGYAVGVPALALAIIALVSLLWEKASFRAIIAAASPVGRMALTNYLLQTVVCVAIFYGYGLGWFGRTEAAMATLIAFIIFAAQAVMSALWLRAFAYGPLEWLWRQLTYRKRLPMRRGAAVG